MSALYYRNESLICTDDGFVVGDKHYVVNWGIPSGNITKVFIYYYPYYPCSTEFYVGDVCFSGQKDLKKIFNMILKHAHNAKIENLKIEICELKGLSKEKEKEICEITNKIYKINQQIKELSGEQ